MGTTVLRKEELLAMLQSISSQLEQLEKSIESRIPNKQIEWQKEQNILIEVCEKRLTKLENMISTSEEKEEINVNQAYMVKQSFSQESFTY